MSKFDIEYALTNAIKGQALLRWGGNKMWEDVIPHIPNGGEEHMGENTHRRSTPNHRMSPAPCPVFLEVVGNNLLSLPNVGLYIPPDSNSEVQRDPSAFVTLIDSYLP